MLFHVYLELLGGMGFCRSLLSGISGAWVFLLPVVFYTAVYLHGGGSSWIWRSGILDPMWGIFGCRCEVRGQGVSHSMLPAECFHVGVSLVQLVRLSLGMFSAW